VATDGELANQLHAVHITGVEPGLALGTVRAPAGE
jgi:hypothetical protein